MYKILKTVIDSKDFKLEDILYKISKMYVESKITEEQKSELDELARSHAKAENSYASANAMIAELFERIKAVESEIDALKNKDTTTEDTEEPEPVDEYPAYVQPSGAHDAYVTGDKVTYNNKKYICKMDGCVWAPDVYPAGWEEIIEESVEQGE